MESDQACGGTWPASLAKYDPASSSWKTAQCSLFEDLEPCSVTWPRWGLMLAGEFLELPTSALPTLEKESGSWDTPCKGDAHPRAYKRTKPYNGPGQEHLQSQAYKRLTPNCVEGGKLNPEWVEWLMGWPMGWTGLQPLETDKFQEWQRLHSPSWPNN
jgi:hypothetical protein